MHVQTLVKVNASVDEGVADLVALLSSIDGVETLQSCQGYPGTQEGYVYFACGNWKNLCSLVFERIGPALKLRIEEDATITIRFTDSEQPVAKLSFRAETSKLLVSALKEGLR